MVNFSNKLQNILLNASTFFNKNKTILIISGAFAMVMPMTLVGSIFSLFKGLPIDSYQVWITSNGLSSLFGDVYQWTVGLLSIYITFSVGYQFAKKNKMKKTAVTIGLISILSFLIVTPYTVQDASNAVASLPITWLGSSGMFMAILIGFGVGFIFWFCQKFHIQITLPEEVPPFIANQFTALIPVFIVAILSMIIKVGFSLTSFGDVQTLIYTIVRTPLNALTGNMIGVWVISTFCALCWFFGIHGGLIVMPISMLLFQQFQLENLAAYQAGLPLQHMITGMNLSTGTGALTMIVAMMIFAKSKSAKSISSISLVPAFFGIDEPAYFGYPLILNPIFFIPYVIIAPIVITFGTWILLTTGLIPYFTGTVGSFNFPFFIQNFIGFGWQGCVWGFIMFAILVITWIPFIKIYDKQMKNLEESKTTTD